MRVKGWSRLNLNDAQARYVAGESCSSIGRSYEMSGVNVWKQLQRHFPGLTKPRRAEFDATEAKKLWDTGLSCTSIGKMIGGMSGTLVHRKLRRAYPGQIKGGMKARRQSS